MPIQHKSGASCYENVSTAGLQDLINIFKHIYEFKTSIFN